MILAIYRPFSLSLVSILIGCALPIVAQGQDVGDFEPILFADEVVFLSRLVSEPIKGRWVAVELISASRNNKNEFIPMFRDLVSVDCRNHGVEKINSAMNLEQKIGNPANWIYWKSDPRYREGFSPEKIEHRSPVQVAEEERKEMEEKLKAPPAPSSRSFREPLEVAVEFAYSVLSAGGGEREIAEALRRTSGFNDLISLSCTLGNPEVRDGRKTNITVRFHEALGYVQLQGAWSRERSLTSEEIRVSIDSLDLKINRVTGYARLNRKNEEGVALEGSCDLAPVRRKF